MNANNDIAKCKGQDDDGTMVCGYRERCARYVRPAGDKQTWEALWKAGDDCPQYLSLKS